MERKNKIFKKEDKKLKGKRKIIKTQKLIE